jgi:hypothetical protein
MSTTTDSRSTMIGPAPKAHTSAGSEPLGSQDSLGPQAAAAAEGQDSPQAMAHSPSIYRAPAGTNASHGHRSLVTHPSGAVAASIPGGHEGIGTHHAHAAGDSEPGRPAANHPADPVSRPLLADPLLSLAADVLDDLEKVRVANENRLRQLTRSEEDSDGETRGFGLDEAHPDVARLAALVDMLGDAEHKAELNLGRLMRQHPLGPWAQRTRGLGPRQIPRLIASIGDPYIRPVLPRQDGTTEPSRPRTVSELWAYCGYHVLKTSVSGHTATEAQGRYAADGVHFPAGQRAGEAHQAIAGGDQDGHLGHPSNGVQSGLAGVAPKRARGQRANWSATAKMRAYLVAVSCMKCMDSPYRKVYDDAREKYADAVHQVPCIRCGPSGKPAGAGSALSDGHKHARALRAVAKEVLKDLWREAKRLHEESA